MKPLTVVTLNTWKCDGAYRRRLQLMAEGLGRLEADIVLLQEVFVAADSSLDTGRFIAGRLGLHLCFHPARRKTREVEGVAMDGYSGLAVLSRYPPGESGALPLQEDERDDDRWAQWVRINVDGVRLMVINTHLCHLQDRDDLREQQLRRIVSHASAQVGAQLMLLGGDLNSGPNSRPLNWLEQQAQCRVRSAWSETGYLDLPGTLNAGEARTCIDHLYRFETDAIPMSWVEVGTAMDQADRSGVFPSDHAAVMARLNIREGSPGRIVNGCFRP
jgi:endonuclease/exonuclease/phosphatase family metal-dependent hydrolase